MLVDKDICCGCGVCSKICPRNACIMERDSEGFYYPSISSELCIHCGLCEKYCPVLEQDKAECKSTDVIINRTLCGHLRESEDVKTSSSGGAATALARKILNLGGVVYGCAYSEDYTYSHHIRITSVSQVSFLKGSKYNQSRKDNNIYESVKKDLIRNTLVLFVGTPCEVAAIKMYLRHDYKNFISVQLICEGTMSETILEQYVSNLKRKYKSHIVDFQARHKKYEWAPAYIRAKFENGKSYEKLAHYTDYGEAHRLFLRPSCYRCHFKGNASGADITIGDCWGLPRNSSLWYKWGVSLIIIHTSKGMDIVDNLDDFIVSDIDFSKIKNPRFTSSTPYSSEREVFSRYFVESGLSFACKKTRSGKMTVKRALYFFAPDAVIELIKK